MELSREVIDRIVELAPPETVLVGDRTYATGKLSLVTPPTAMPLGFQSLAGLVEYVKSGPDGLVPTSIAVHVESFRHVAVVSALREPTYHRHEYARAEAFSEPADKRPIERWIDHEQFMIALAAMFEPDAACLELQRIARTVTAEETRTSADDGISQEVTAKAGTRLLERVTLPGRVTLRPYRTFREIQQPPSEFVFRVRATANGPQMALFEADGGTWKITAMAWITDYLKAALGEPYTVLG